MKTMNNYSDVAESIMTAALFGHSFETKLITKSDMFIIRFKNHHDNYFLSVMCLGGKNSVWERAIIRDYQITRSVTMNHIKSLLNGLNWYDEPFNETLLEVNRPN